MLDHFFMLGDICLHNDNYNKCNECNLILPFDLDFYSNKTIKELKQEENDEKNDNDCISNNKNIFNNKYNLCKECYLSDKIEFDKKQNLNLIKISSGLDNISD